MSLTIIARWVLSVAAVFTTLPGLVCAQSPLPVEGAGAWFAQSDYLYWTRRSPGLEYAVTDIGGVQDRGPVGQVLSLGSEYSGGFRLALGRQIGGPDGAQVRFTYTDFDSSQAETRLGPLRATFVSSDNGENNDSDDSVNDVTPDDRATSATAGASFDYQLYDLELGQTLVLTDSLSVRVAAGGRAAMIDDRFDVTYTGGDFQSPFNAFQTTSYQGGGFVVGGDLRWQLTSAWRIDFDTALSLLLGRVETNTFIPDDEPGVPTNVSFAETRMTPVLEMAMGLNYQRRFGQFDVNFKAGYELTNWFNLDDSRVFTDSYIEAQNTHLIRDLSLDGLFARATVGF